MASKQQTPSRHPSASGNVARPGGFNSPQFLQRQSSTTSQDSGSTEAHSDEDGNETIVAKNKPRRVGPTKVEFTEDTGKRTQRLVTRAETLIKRAKELKIMTEAQVLVKIHYETPGRPIPYEYKEGEDFLLDFEKRRGMTGSHVSSMRASASPQSGITARAVTSPDAGAVTRARSSLQAGGSAGHQSSSPRETEASVTPTQNDGSNANLPFVSSPVSRSQVMERSERSVCVLCDSKMVLMKRDGRTMRVESIGIRCAGITKYMSGKKHMERPCESWVHADCQGYPGLTEEDQQRMPGWYCIVHANQGRQLNHAVAREI